MVDRLAQVLVGVGHRIEDIHEHTALGVDGLRCGAEAIAGAEREGAGVDTLASTTPSMIVESRLCGTGKTPRPLKSVLYQGVNADSVALN